MKSYFLYMNLILLPNVAFNQDFHLKGTFTEIPFPGEALNDTNSVHIESAFITVDGAKVRYRLGEVSGVRDKGKSLLLLHGAAFNSLTWIDRIDTVQKLTAAGYQVISVDLPGFADTTGRPTTSRGDFLANLIEALPLESKPVVVSPSFSGGYSLPALVSHSDKFCGFVPVAPGAASSYGSRLRSVRVPTLIVVGERDRSSGREGALRMIPTSSDIIEIPNGSHPAYLDNPSLWHQLLFNFMERVDC